ncbi:MAG: hypothetical protein JKY94_16345 [Rhodobacteraceae bacterium]|nr:hypothetical protein [Paracoccaceae bacterium]
MAGEVHELAPHDIPAFLPSADGSDPLFTGIIVVVVISAVLIGTLYLRLHALPERISHHLSPVQFTLVATLGLLALFTHQNLYWVAALLLALVRFPDLEGPLNSIAASLRAMQGDKIDPTPAEKPDTPVKQTGSEE